MLFRQHRAGNPPGMDDFPDATRGDKVARILNAADRPANGIDARVEPGRRCRIEADDRMARLRQGARQRKADQPARTGHENGLILLCTSNERCDRFHRIFDDSYR